MRAGSLSNGGKRGQGLSGGGTKVSNRDVGSFNGLSDGGDVTRGATEGQRVGEGGNTPSARGGGMEGRRRQQWRKEIEKDKPLLRGLASDTGEAPQDDHDSSAMKRSNLSWAFLDECSSVASLPKVETTKRQARLGQGKQEKTQAVVLSTFSALPDPEHRKDSRGRRSRRRAPPGAQGHEDQPQ